MQVEIFSRHRLQKHPGGGKTLPDGVAVISFYTPAGWYTPGSKPIKINGPANRVFYAAVPDMDYDSLGQLGTDYQSFFSDAPKLAGFILQAARDGCDIWCQSERGQCRAAGCAAAIRQFFSGDGIEIFADKQYYPSRLVYRKVYDALKAAAE